MISFVCYDTSVSAYPNPDYMFFYKKRYTVDDINEFGNRGEFSHKVETLPDFLNKRDNKFYQWPIGM